MALATGQPLRRTGRVDDSSGTTPPPRHDHQSATCLRKAAVKSRDPWFDNARFIAAALILIFHFADGLRAHSALVASLYHGTWAFRLPVYIVIAGYFSHGPSLSRPHRIQLFRNILFVYLAVYCLSFLGGAPFTGHWTFNPLAPSFALWFLLSLFWWRLTLPVIARRRHPLVIAIAAAAIGGFLPMLDHTLALSRTVAFWPLFVLGWMLRDGRLRAVLDHGVVRVFSALAVPLLLLAGHVLHPVIGDEALAMDSGHPPGADGILAAGIRLAILVTGAIGALAVMSLIARRRLPVLTYVGSGSFYIYILHPLLLQPLRNFDLIPSLDSDLGAIAFLLACGVIALALGSRPVRAATRWLIQPRYTWPFELTFLPPPTGSPHGHDQFRYAMVARNY